MRRIPWKPIAALAGISAPQYTAVNFWAHTRLRVKLRSSQPIQPTPAGGPGKTCFTTGTSPTSRVTASGL